MTTSDWLERVGILVAGFTLAARATTEMTDYSAAGLFGMSCALFVSAVLVR